MDKDTWIAQNLFPKNTEANANRKLRRGVTSVSVHAATRKTKFTLCVFGSWAIYMPPYNLARLCSLTREAGFKTFVYDFNVESHYALKDANPALEDAWNGANYWWWQGDEYYKRIHPTYEPILDSYVDTLLADEPDIIGLSTYYTNFLPTQYVIRKIRAKAPHITIVMGGPECHEREFKLPKEADYYFIGESEQNILDFLNNWEDGIKPTQPAIGSLYSDTRIDIDSLPYPDYSDFDIPKYLAKNAICAEISRGCIAKCSYCTEVYYWKFRDRGAKNVVDELEYQVERYGINFVSFVDSLMNGNLKEFRRFCESLVERKLGITWWGYARADGRMDLEFYQLMKEAGAQGFNYGIESGSDKVLALVNKKNTVAEINQNLIDSEKVGMKVSACWVIGAPGEDIEGFNHSFNMLWNHRSRIFAISPGPGLGDNHGSAYDDREKYNMNPRDKQWLGGWWTKDLSNTRVHRHMRIKLMHIWLEMCKKFNGTLTNVHYVGDQIAEHFDVEFNHELLQDEVKYENFDFNIIKTDLGNFADTLMNEVFGLFRLLWRVKGGYEMTIRFNPELDERDFTFAMTPDAYKYNATLWFKIDDAGNYTTKCSYDFINLDKVHVKLDGFNHIYEGSGKWDHPQEVKQSKLIWIKPVDYYNDYSVVNNLPIEHCFVNTSIEDRMLFYKTAKRLEPSSTIVETDPNLGGITSILAAGSVMSKVYSLDNFDAHIVGNMYEGVSKWVDSQLADWCNQHRKNPELGTKLIERVKTNSSQSESASTTWRTVTANYSNISLITNCADIEEIDLLVLNKTHAGINKSSYNLIDRVKPNGFVLIYSYHSMQDEIDELTSKGWNVVDSETGGVVLQKLS